MVEPGAGTQSSPRAANSFQAGVWVPTAERISSAVSGILPAAVIVQDRSTIVEHAAYWTTARSLKEARYLTAVLNNETTRALCEMQPKGLGGTRHFDNRIWELPIPEFDRCESLHVELATTAATAQRIAARVELTEGAHFTRQRRAIRDALLQHGVAREIDGMVMRLLRR